MEYSEFLDDVKRCIEWNVEEGFDVRINRIIKNNSVELDGVVFFKDGDHISPNIYLNSYFDRYQNGESVEAIANEIIKVYFNAMHDQGKENYDLQFSFESMSASIIFRLVNFTKNRKLLEELPHIRFLDLAITFHCLVRQDENGIGTVRITTEHMNSWNTSVKELMRLAAVNTPKFFPLRIRTMNEVIREILKKDMSEMFARYEYPFNENSFNQELDCEECREDPMEEAISRMLSESSENEIPMYIMTNSNGINGASAILYQDVLKDFAVEKESDFYILPSSIHEIILIPYQEKLNPDTLSDMVQDVNQSQVPVEEILSGKVYLYRRATNSFEY